MIEYLTALIKANIDSFYHSIIKNIGWAFMGNIVAVATALAESVILANYLSLDSYGIYLMLVSVVALIFGILDCRSREVVIKFLPQLKLEEGAVTVAPFMRLVFSLDFFLAIVSVLILWSMTPVLDRFMTIDASYLGILLILATGMVFKGAVKSVGSYMRVTGRFELSVIIGGAAKLIRLLIIILAVNLEADLLLICWSVVVSDVILFVIYGAVILYVFRSDQVAIFDGSTKLTKLQKKGIRQFIYSVNMTNIVRVVSSKLDVIVIGVLGSPSYVAIYKIASQFARIPVLFSDPLSTAIYPEISQLYAKNEMSKLRRLILMLTKGLSVLGLFIIALFGVFGESILDMLFDSKYSEALGSIFIMLVGALFSFVFFWSRLLLVVMGVTYDIVYIVTAAACLQFLCLFIFVPLLGVTGGAIGFSVYFVTMNIAFLFLIKKNGSTSFKLF